ncbi:LysM peptidoglycan-binding domain-containing protein [uncultured Polaribacter sp.]|uniref:LysM peptidoglycan-binding domain-containing protein n=1 Tax=uncultured Polaribacter sp. TaxID=174711 RepID=UPI00260B965D|nr:LysM peptidoglycan-binding domain-containing protein [uncultured Polaribacter sp.]
MKHLQFFVFLCMITFTISCGQQKKYIEYKVKEGESMRLIAKKLDIKTRDLLRLNPGISKKPAPNTVIIIPNKKSSGVKNTKDNASKEKAKDVISDKQNNFLADKKKQKELLLATLKKDYKIHLVKKGDTFYSLTRFYKVSSEDLVNLNPELSEGLKTGQVIKIAKLAVKEEAQEEVELETEEDVLLYSDVIQEGIRLKTAIFLPFRTQELDTLSENDIFDNSKLANIVTDMYLGAEIAIDSLRKQGISIDVSVFDTGKNSTKLNTIIAENNLNENDVIIGPLYSEEVKMLANKVNTPIVFPVYSKKQASFSTKQIVTTAPNKTEYRLRLSNYFQEKVTKGNVIIVRDGTSDAAIHAEKLSIILKAKDSVTLSTITSEDGYIKREKFTEALKPNVDNVVILTTKDPIIVASAVNSLISLEEDVTARVFTFDKNSAFNKIDNLKLAKLDFTYVSDEYSKEDVAEVINFNAKFLSKNGVLPNYYATKGFDVTYDVLMRLASGKSLKKTFSEGVSYRVQSKFDYEKNMFKTTENKGLFMVKFNADLTLSTID